MRITGNQRKKEKKQNKRVSQGKTTFEYKDRIKKVEYMRQCKIRVVTEDSGNNEVQETSKCAKFERS